MTDLVAELVPLDSLVPDPDNARKHNDANLSAIKSSLIHFGQVKPIVATADGVVIAGNATLTAARDLGWKKVAVVRTPADWSHDQAMAYALADNRTAELAEWDHEVLATQLVDLDAVGWDLASLGFPALEPPLDPEPVDPGRLLGPEKLAAALRCPSCGHEWTEGKK